MFNPSAPSHWLHESNTSSVIGPILKPSTWLIKIHGDPQPITVDESTIAEGIAKGWFTLDDMLSKGDGAWSTVRESLGKAVAEIKVYANPSSAYARLYAQRCGFIGAIVAPLFALVYLLITSYQREGGLRDLLSLVISLVIVLSLFVIKNWIKKFVVFMVGLSVLSAITGVKPSEVSPTGFLVVTLLSLLLLLLLAVVIAGAGIALGYGIGYLGGWVAGLFRRNRYRSIIQRQPLPESIRLRSTSPSDVKQSSLKSVHILMNETLPELSYSKAMKLFGEETVEAVPESNIKCSRIPKTISNSRDVEQFGISYLAKGGFVPNRSFDEVAKKIEFRFGQVAGKPVLLAKVYEPEIGIYQVTTPVWGSPSLGVSFADMVAMTGQPLSGAYIKAVTPNSPAARAGLCSGDIIEKIADELVEVDADAEHIIERLPTDRPIPLIIRRGNRTFETRVFL